MSAPARPLIHLQVENAQFTLQLPDTQPGQALAIASLPAIRRYLQHEPATAIEIETAIAAIEDVLIPVVKRLPARANLVTHAAAIGQILVAASLPNRAEMCLDRAAVELLFNRLAAMAYGTPPAQAGLPADRDFAASLLILRELLHHGGFDAITIQA